MSPQELSLSTQSHIDQTLLFEQGVENRKQSRPMIVPFEAKLLLQFLGTSTVASNGRHLCLAMVLISVS
jgi:hypothetical protein